MALAENVKNVPYHRTRAARSAERRKRAWELQLRGWTQTQIAEDLGVTHQAVSLMLRATLDELAASELKSAEDYRKAEIARLDRMLDTIEPRAANGDPVAQGQVLAIMSRRAKYLGLDAPVKVEVTEGVAEELKKARERAGAR